MKIVSATDNLFRTSSFNEVPDWPHTEMPWSELDTTDTIQHYLRGGHTPQELPSMDDDEGWDHPGAYVDLIDHHMRSSYLPGDRRLYRGVEDLAKTVGVTRERAKSSLVGHKFVENGYSSTSEHPVIAAAEYTDVDLSDRPKGAVFHMFVPGSTPALRGYEGHQEVVLPRGIEYEITDDSKEGRLRHLQVKLNHPDISST